MKFIHSFMNSIIHSFINLFIIYTTLNSVVGAHQSQGILMLDDALAGENSRSGGGFPGNRLLSGFSRSL